MRVDYREGQFMFNPYTQRFEFKMVQVDHGPIRSVCACCINKQRSRVKGPRAMKIFLKGSGPKTV